MSPSTNRILRLLLVCTLLCPVVGFIREYSQYLAARSTGHPANAHDAELNKPQLPLRWMAPFLSGGGYASEALAYAMGLYNATSPDMYVDLSIQQHGDSVNSEFIQGMPALEYSVLGTLMSKPQSNGIVVCHSEPGAWHLGQDMPARYHTSICPSADAKFKVGRTMFETDRLPDGWVARLNRMDELWVPTKFAFDVFVQGGVKAEKLLILPESVDTAFFNRANVAHLPVNRFMKTRPFDCEGHVGTRADCPFRFFSVGKWERRKNFEALVRAYVTEFYNAATYGTAVELYVLTSAYHSTSDFAAAVDALIQTEIRCSSAASVALLSGYRSLDNAALADVNVDASGEVGRETSRTNICLTDAELKNHERIPPIKLLHGVPQKDLPLVYASMDAFVSPTRGEGWGRPHAEAMAMGLPVIATNWSGLTEFMHDNNSYPLQYRRLAPIPDGAFAGHLQAEADITDLQRLMRHVLEHQDEARAKGQRAREDMVEKYGLEALSGFIREQIRRISASVE